MKIAERFPTRSETQTRTGENRIKLRMYTAARGRQIPQGKKNSFPFVNIL